MATCTPSWNDIALGDIGTWVFSTGYAPARHGRFTVTDLHAESQSVRILLEHGGAGSARTIKYRPRTKARWVELDITKPLEWARCNHIVWRVHLPDAPDSHDPR